MDRIKLFVCCHREERVPEHPLLVPVQVGSGLAESRFSGFMHDDKGDNISRKNRSYCELTALYWAWKNIESDYYGLFHYRRYLYPDIKARRPYKMCGTATEKLLQSLSFNCFSELICHYDLIAPIAEDMHMSVREHYANAPYHHGRDLELAELIVLEKYPGMAAAMENYLSGTCCYFGNICIMKKPVFKDYCEWLFSILDEFDSRADAESYSAQERRVNGYLAERLFGVYYTYHRDHLKTIELPRVHFERDRTTLLKKKTLNILLPPSSKRRAAAKRVAGNK